MDSIVRRPADDAKKASTVVAAMESSLPSLPNLYESVRPSIVRVETTSTMSVTGVIVSPDGYILVDGRGTDDMKVHLSDGRTVTARAAGWSSEWGLSVMKINEGECWPAVKLGSTKKLEAGESCLVIGYSHRGDTKFDASPMARFGLIDRNVPTSWFTTTCFPGFFDGAAVIGIDGQLLGIFTHWSGTQSYATAMDVFTEIRDDLFDGKNVDWIRYPPAPESIYFLDGGDAPEKLGMRKTDDVLGAPKPPRQMEPSQLSETMKTAEETTVRLVSKERQGFDGKDYTRWSGVIVSDDGYILTCAHADQLPGERITVRLSDGRNADAIAIGTNPISDIGLVKITSPGPWPFARMNDSSALRPGDPLVVAGYPAFNSNGEWSSIRTPVLCRTAVRRDKYMLWGIADSHSETVPAPQGGMSGGGTFDANGRYVGTYLGSGHIRVEVAKTQWESLTKVDSIDTISATPHPLRKQFEIPSESAAQSVVELLVDSKPICVGTIVDASGLILAKASLLDGDVSCRTPDRSIFNAERLSTLQDHDLALLRVDVTGLTPAEFSQNETPSIGQMLCAVGPDQMIEPGIVSTATRLVPPEPAWTGNATHDTPDGPILSRMSGGWQNNTNLSLRGTKLQIEDVIVSIDGHSTPNTAKLREVLQTRLVGHCTGDLVSVEVLRSGSPLKVRTSLPRATVVNYWMLDEHDSRRRSGFPAVFDTDIELPQHRVGGPVIDSEGQIRGIAIASRGRNETQRGPTTVLPSRDVQRVVSTLISDARKRVHPISMEKDS
ncbi:MAG: trypsin-like peptidase domain-containing protein [Planctomycetota bacterium]